MSLSNENLTVTLLLTTLVRFSPKFCPDYQHKRYPLRNSFLRQLEETLTSSKFTNTGSVTELCENGAYYAEICTDFCVPRELVSSHTLTWSTLADITVSCDVQGHTVNSYLLSGQKIHVQISVLKVLVWMKKFLN